MRPFTLATLVILLATLAISPANAAGSTVVVSGFASVPATTTGATEVHVAGIKGMTLIDVCTGTANGGFTFSGDTVGDFIRVQSNDFNCTSVSGIALPANEVISCTPSFNAPTVDSFCTVSGLE